MNLYQSLNNWATGFIFAAILYGIWKVIGDSDINLAFVAQNADSLFLALFIVFFRVKMHLDDHKYFKGFDEDKTKYKYVGFLISVLVWFFMAFSGGMIPKPENSTLLLAIALILSTIWIAVHLMEIAKTSGVKAPLKYVAALRHKWIIINMMYVLLLVLYSNGAEVLIRVWQKEVDIIKWGFIVLMIAIMICDHWISEPHSA